MVFWCLVSSASLVVRAKIFLNVFLPLSLFLICRPCSESICKQQNGIFLQGDNNTEHYRLQNTVIIITLQNTRGQQYLGTAYQSDNYKFIAHFIPYSNFHCPCSCHKCSTRSSRSWLCATGSSIFRCISRKL